MSYAAAIQQRHHRDASRSPGLPPFVRDALLSVVALVATALAVHYALKRLDTPVEQLAVNGSHQRVSASEVASVLEPALDVSLLQVDLAQARKALEKLPWVASARVDRVWPAKVSVQLREREVFARWGKAEAVSTEGVVFAVGDEKLPDLLPMLEGPAGREREVMELYLSLADRLAETPFSPTALRLDARGDWSATTKSGVLLRFGRESPLNYVERLKLVVLPELGSRLNQVARVDLRYANGFAVSWRAAPADDASVFDDPESRAQPAGRNTP